MMHIPSLTEICAKYGTESADIEIKDVYHSSKDVTKNSIFFALPGLAKHGAKFASEAIENGACAIFTDRTGAALIEKTVPVVVVEDPRAELATVSGLIYGPQIADLHLWGITGTNGKTTTSYFLRQLLPQPAALIGTTGVFDGQSRKLLSRTTPEIDDLYRELIKLRKSGIKKVVLEVSSHALVLNRVSGLKFKSVAFTNLSQDHLDFHKTMDAYLQAKAKLFTKEFSDYAVVCVDSPEGDAIADLASSAGLVVATVSTTNDRGTWNIDNEQNGNAQLSARINPVDMRLRLRVGGRFNFANALVAIAMADQVSEITQSQVDELAKVEVPGRMQVIAKNGATVIVDYAHSPAAISSVISSLRDLVSGKLIVVLGAGGDRDSSKREFMGSALNGADLIFVTDDNPRTEDPALIRKAIIAGINSIGMAFVEVPDRALAITQAVNSIESPEDLVLILGKGHEQGQQVGNVTMDFDDVATAENAVENRVVNE